MGIQRERGFTLIEVAIVMIIIGLVMGGGLAIMRTLTDRKFRNESVDYLNNARKAALAFAEINGRLPWADSDDPPDGNENSGETAGVLPFNTIGLSPSDPYGRPVKYEINTGLTTDVNPITNMVASCNVLKSPLTNRPEILDTDSGATTVVSAAAVMISAGPMDADDDNDVFDAASGGNNTTGSPNYIRTPPVQGLFDDLAVYITGNELFGEMCDMLVLSVSDERTPPSAFHVYDVTTGTDLAPPCKIVSGTEIEIRTLPGGNGSIIPTIPQTPFSLAGKDYTIRIP